MRILPYIGLVFAFSGCLGSAEKYRVARYGVSGIVKDEESNTALSNVFVVAYYYESLSRRVPEFKFTVTDKDGLFRIPNEYEEAKTRKEPFVDRVFNTLFPPPKHIITAWNWDWFSGPEKPAGLFVSVDGKSIVDCTNMSTDSSRPKDLPSPPANFGLVQSEVPAMRERINKTVQDICEILRQHPAPIPQAFSTKPDAGKMLEISIKGAH